MLDIGTGKNHHGAGPRGNIALAIRQKQAQLTAIARLPHRVQIGYHRYGAQRAVLKTIEMALIAGPGRI